jgi:hypothetical protein
LIDIHIPPDWHQDIDSPFLLAAANMGTIQKAAIQQQFEHCQEAKQGAFAKKPLVVSVY